MALGEADWPTDAVEVGRILGAWGVKGWVRIQPFSSDPQALFSSKRWFVKPPQGPGAPPKVPGAVWPDLVRVVQAKEHGDGVVAQLRDLDDRAGAEALRGARLFVARSSFPTADADEFYWVDLLGMAVFNREGESLGVVAGLLETGAHCVLELTHTEGEPPRLLPFVAAYVDSVDQAQRKIVVDWGLDY